MVMTDRWADKPPPPPPGGAAPAVREESGILKRGGANDYVHAAAHLGREREVPYGRGPMPA